eukprot:TRINITY_DN4270_c0_g1_i2.p1 TRINITY_DN4270_c0_g1~~TRINITY_DN4270_c0_g1_i2.p1  ORF type:complete len:484 (+),score=71.53 TRINITY_DN4270_c0_g1_i2:52-1503(+)
MGSGSTSTLPNKAATTTPPHSPHRRTQAHQRSRDNTAHHSDHTMHHTDHTTHVGDHVLATPPKPLLSRLTAKSGSASHHTLYTPPSDHAATHPPRPVAMPERGARPLAVAAVASVADAPQRALSITALWPCLFPNGLSAPGDAVLASLVPFDAKESMIFSVLTTPFHLEKAISFGLLLCFDQFLTTLVLSPLRFVTSSVSIMFGMFKSRVSQREIASFFYGLMILCTMLGMSHLNPSVIYHEIRGQNILKLYVILNILDIIDKLCAAYGHDVFENLTLTYSHTEYRTFKRMICYPILTLLYCYIHTMVAFIQMVSLSVASTTDTDGLFAMLISNQFAELKSFVLKKNERESAYQLLFADIVERFNLFVFLSIVFLMHVRDSTVTNNKSTEQLLRMFVFIITSEIITDWVKHGFVNKFNKFNPADYSIVKFLLCRDILTCPAPSILDTTEVACRRIGFTTLPLACVVMCKSPTFFFQVIFPASG